MSLRTRLLFALCCLLPPAAAGTVDEDLDAYLRIARVRVSSAPDALFPSPGPFHRRNTLAALEKLARRPRPIQPDEVKLSISLISAKVPSDAGLRRAG